MTPAQIDLEFAHMTLDRKLQSEAAGEKVYEDEDYEEYDNDTDNEDNLLSETFNCPSVGAPYDVISEVEDEWEDV